MPCVQRLGENARKAKAAPSKHHTHVNSVAFLCVAKCGVKGLALMNGTAKLCRNKETELFLYCIYPCYFYYNAVLLWKWSHACGVVLDLLTIVRRWTQQIYFIVQFYLLFISRKTEWICISNVFWFIVELKLKHYVKFAGLDSQINVSEVASSDVSWCQQWRQIQNWITLKS